MKPHVEVETHVKLGMFIHTLENSLYELGNPPRALFEIKIESEAYNMLKNIVCFNQVRNHFKDYYITYELEIISGNKILRFMKIG